MTAQYDLHLLDAVGFLAGALTASAFAQTAAAPMRVTAIAANLCFLTYAAMGGFVPILTLHAILLPVNAVRLAQAVRRSGRGRPFRDIRRVATGHGLGDRSLWAAGLFASGLVLSPLVTLPLAMIPQARSQALSSDVIAMPATALKIRAPR